jgi:hypothetical protein
VLIHLEDALMDLMDVHGAKSLGRPLQGAVLTMTKPTVADMKRWLSAAISRALNAGLNLRLGSVMSCLCRSKRTKPRDHQARGFACLRPAD